MTLLAADWRSNSDIQFIISLSNDRLPETIGNKAINLRQMSDKGYLIPDSFVCTWEAYDEYLKIGSKLLPNLNHQLDSIVDENKHYAVRSSANVEDGLEHSFAGQFATFLDQKGVEQILQSIQAIWDAAQSESVKTYLGALGVQSTSLKMAIIIQEMVTPVYSGVAFSKNPITTFDEVVVEAVLGTGLSLVQEGKTPMRWVNKWGGWIEQPQQATVQVELIEKVVEQTKSIARSFNREVDLEWIYDGRQLYWLQLRDITAFSVSEIYSNKISREVLPGLIHPLVWSVSVPLPSKAWVKIITEVIGQNDIDPYSLMRGFRYRAYFNMGVFAEVFESLGMPHESLEMMLGMVPPGAGRPPFRPGMQIIRFAPRTILFLIDKWTFAKKLKEHYPRLLAESKKYSSYPPIELDESELLRIVDQIAILNEELAYYTIVTMLLMQIYNSLLKSRLRAAGVDIQNFDLTEGMIELRLYDPNVQLALLNHEYNQLEEGKKTLILEGNLADFQQMGGIGQFQKNFEAFLEKFGYLSDATSHFGYPPWRETPEFVLKLIANFDMPDETSSKVKYSDLEIGGLHGWYMKLIYKRARWFQLYREKISSLYSYSLMLFRAYYLAIGERLVESNLLNSREDILFLYDDEIRATVNDEAPGDDFHRLVTKRKVEMDLWVDAILPDVIFGDEPPPIVVSPTGRLSGTPTSRGYYTGKVTVVRSVSEFQKVDSGDVIVIPYSDVSWVPLFARAGAVVAEAGGILSHSSIVAREYGLPAVVSVDGACSQLEDGITVTVDGYAGQITIHRDGDCEESLEVTK